MGGGRRRPGKNPTAGGPLHGAGAGASAGRRRRPLPTQPSPSSIETPARSLLRCGSNPGSVPPKGNSYAFGYTYPSSSNSGEILLAGSSGGSPPLVAFVDPSPSSDPGAGVPIYSYDPSLIGGLGLGFPAEAEGDDREVVGGVGLGFGVHEENEELELGAGEERIEDVEVLPTPEAKKERKNEGFLSIGGIRVYTEDTSSPEEEIGSSEEDDSDDDDDGDSIEDEDEEEGEEEGDEEDEEKGDKEEGSSEEDELSSDDGSDIDDEIAEDYMEGIGGDAELLTAHWLAAGNLDESDEDGFLKRGGSSSQKKGKLGGNDVMNASEQYGMKKPKLKKGKGNVGRLPNPPDVNLLTLDDMFMVKDPRRLMRRKQTHAHLSQSWPCAERKSKKYGNVPGEKKKHRRELIAVKRRQRMINRGVDLEQINCKLRQMVVDEVDMFSFQPMHSCDCSQVRRLASVYRLQSGCQGSGKKRFVIVTRTGQTCLPSSADKIRLDKLLGVGIDDDDDLGVNTDKKMNPRARAKASWLKKPTDNREFSGKKSSTRKKSSGSFAERPVSFISSGTMRVDMQVDSTIKTAVAVDSNASVEKDEKDDSARLGAFEIHTKGFGSRMMAKMGFEGHGLGKDGQGIVRPVEAVQRPKSLGLGAQFMPCGASSVKEESKSFGSFEKHTKGFGSRMMTKMGFVPGTGLGKDGRGITDPLTAVRRPKLQGLGVKD